MIFFNYFRIMENEVVKVENEKSLLAVDVENLRAELFKKSSTLSELDKRCNSQEKLLLDQLKDIQQSERLIVKKTGEVQKLNAKLQKLVDDQGVIISLQWKKKCCNFYDTFLIYFRVWILDLWSEKF
jgi:chromosome segregation ATPase